MDYEWTHTCLNIDHINFYILVFLNSMFNYLFVKYINIVRLALIENLDMMDVWMD